MASSEGPGLASLNGLPEAEARRALLACCSSSRWADALTKRRPYASAEDLLEAAEQALAGIDDADLADALDGHPRIGERSESAWSRAEQDGMNGVDPSVAQAMVDANRAYERRFGHVYLVCASGMSAPELLAVLRRRLDNDPEAEHREVRAELGKINRIRLGRLLGAQEKAS